MKACVVMLIAFFLSGCATSNGLLGDLGLGRGGAGNEGIYQLSRQEIVLGLKEALAKGTHTAVNELGREDGFLSNLDVRIPMPRELQTVERTLRNLNQDRLADDFVYAMNRAAEQAVTRASSVFADSIRQMTIEDALGILTGPNDAATQYFRRTTHEELAQEFLPIVKKATGETGVTSAYKQLMDTAVGGGTVGSLGRALLGIEPVDMDAYVTDRALDGLFALVAQEERRIREDPIARTTELLERVFGAPRDRLRYVR